MISVAITHFQRYPMILDSFRDIVDNENISDIVISDDVSMDGSYEDLREALKPFEKIRLHRNSVNLQMSINKVTAISLAQEAYVAILDDDNQFDNSFINALVERGIMEDTIINVPEFAKTEFNFTKYSGEIIDTNKAKEYMVDPMFRCLLNCCNYLVPKNRYIEVFEPDASVGQADTIAFNYQWLKRGFKFYVVPGCQYVHKIHPSSGFLSNLEYNMAKAKHFENLIMQL